MNKNIELILWITFAFTQFGILMISSYNLFFNNEQWECIEWETTSMVKMYIEYSEISSGQWTENSSELPEMVSLIIPNITNDTITWNMPLHYFENGILFIDSIPTYFEMKTINETRCVKEAKVRKL